MIIALSCPPVDVLAAVTAHREVTHAGIRDRQVTVLTLPTSPRALVVLPLYDLGAYLEG